MEPVTNRFLVTFGRGALRTCAPTSAKLHARNSDATGTLDPHDAFFVQLGIIDGHSLVHVPLVIIVPSTPFSLPCQTDVSVTVRVEFVPDRPERDGACRVRACSGLAGYPAGRSDACRADLAGTRDAATQAERDLWTCGFLKRF